MKEIANDFYEDYGDKTLEEKIKEFHHKYNPLHIYCDLMRVGLSSKQAEAYGRFYENWFYNGAVQQIKYIREKHKND